MSAVSKHNVGDSAESAEQIGINGGLKVHTTLVLDTNRDHGDDHGSQDTAEGYMGRLVEISAGRKSG